MQVLDAIECCSKNYSSYNKLQDRTGQNRTCGPLHTVNLQYLRRVQYYPQNINSNTSGSGLREGERERCPQFSALIKPVENLVAVSAMHTSANVRLSTSRRLFAGPAARALLSNSNAIRLDIRTLSLVPIRSILYS